jgi:tetratricopeptide (TPR) repeat protein
MLAKTDRSEPVDLVAAELHRVKAENLVRNGRYKDALAPAVESVRMARAAGDERALIKSLNLRATINMEVPHVDDMLRDADEVAAIADRVGDHASAVNAAVKRSWALVMLEDGEQAIAQGEKALALADRIGSDRDRMVAADNLIRAASLWWRFKTAAAASTVAIEIGPRVGWNAEVANLSAAARLWLLVGRLEVAHGMLEQARGNSQSRLRSGDVLLSMPLHELRVDFILATVLTELARFDEALEVAERCAKHPLTASEPDISNTLRTTLLDILWRRDLPDDRKRLPGLLQTLTDHRPTTGILFGGNNPEIIRAIVSVRLGAAQATELLSHAIDQSEAAAARKPFDCVRGFAKLTAAAGEAGLPELRARSERLREHYARRHASAVAELDRVLA